LECGDGRQPTQTPPANATPPNGHRPAPGEDERKREMLGRLDELRAYLRRKLAAHPVAGREQKLLEDLLRILNILAKAERDGRSNLARVLRLRAVEIDLELPPEVWLG
jgi:hypothetical protein